MELDYQLSNGRWMACGDRSAEFLASAIQYNGREFAIQNGFALNQEQIMERLSSGDSVKSGDDWYSQIRNSELAKIESARLQEKMANYKPHGETVEEFDARDDER